MRRRLKSELRYRNWLINKRDSFVIFCFSGSRSTWFSLKKRNVTDYNIYIYMENFLKGNLTDNKNKLQKINILL